MGAPYWMCAEAFEALLTNRKDNFDPKQNTLLQKEEFETIMAKAEKVVNSTPLWQVSDAE